MAEGLLSGKEYAWEVSAYNEYHACLTYFESGIFETSDLTNTNDLEPDFEFKIAPNILSSASLQECIVEIGKTGSYHVAVWNTLGHPVFKQKEVSFSTNIPTKLEFEGLEPGVHWMVIENKEHYFVEKIMVY